MTIDLDVHEMSKLFGVNEQLLQAVVNSEGPGDAIVRAVRCSEPSVHSRQEALMILSRSLAHALSDFALQPERAGAFLDFFAARWSPVGVTNDPTHLNANMPGNLKRLLGVPV